MAFYVYQLVDPRNGLPFYVGKGQGRRAWQHQLEVERGLCRGNARKISKIREILIAGFDVEVQIVADYELESDALDHEFRLVDRHPTLTNVMPGGGEGRTLTPEQREKRRLARQARVEALRAKERGIKTAIAFERKKAALNALPYASLHAEEINQWVGAQRKAAETPVEEKPDEATGWALAKLKAQAVRDRNKRRRLAKRANLKRRRAEERAAQAASQI